MTNYKLTINDQLFEVQIGAIQGDTAQVTVNQMPYQVKIENAGGPSGLQTRSSVHSVASAAVESAAFSPAPKPATPVAAGSGVILAPIPGKILNIEVHVGDQVNIGQRVGVMEAMKMENNLLSPVDGTVKEIRAAVGTDVGTGDVIMIIG